MIKKIFFIIINIYFSFPGSSAMDDKYSYFGPSSKDEATMSYIFIQKIETMKEEEESPISDKDFLEVEILLKKESKIRDELSALKSQRREIEQNGSYIDICYDCYDPISTFFLINLVREEEEIESELNELNQLTQDLMREIYLRTGRKHPKMRISSNGVLSPLTLFFDQ
jgi:hypothetical protein